LLSYQQQQIGCLTDWHQTLQQQQAAASSSSRRARGKLTAAAVAAAVAGSLQYGRLQA
jgi:hypothetical protein